ncbi:MAG: hypothetical protein E7045_08590 [Lentisphaerae bacterium]|nr:hypothetical protein [Lentisphaerota bacterium]
MNKTLFCLSMLLFCSSIFAIEADSSALELLRKDHPRIFITSDNIEQIRKQALTTSKKQFEKLKAQVDKYRVNPKWNFNPARFVYNKNGKSNFKRPYFMLTQVMTVGGKQAQNAAFVYLVTQDKKYLLKAKNYLKYCTSLYEWALEKQILVDWQNNHYERSIIAYDWLYNDLTPEERKRFANSLLTVVREIQRDGKATFRRNCGGVETGYYGTERLLFYAGAAIYGDGIDDQEAEKQLIRGIKGFNEMLAHREKISAGTGALVHYCVAYTFLEYPLSSLRYFFAVKSAFNVNEAARWTHMRDFPVFVALNWLPGERFPLEFGLGDAHHIDNAMPVDTMNMVMRSIASLYPESAGLALALFNKLPARIKNKGDDFVDFILPPVSDIAAGKIQDVPKFSYISSIGTAYFRSGNTKTDTYACFRAGNPTRNHSHYDQNHFTIYKQGFQAIDSGTRGRTQSFHLPYYYAQSVAHNTVLIDMPNEEIGKHFGPAHHGYKCEAPFMDGGQYKKVINAKIKTSHTADYSAVLCDATEAYRPEKCKLAEREFIHLQKDVFLVVDKVISTNSSYRKRWLLHTQNEISVNGKTYSASEGKGKISGTLLWPKNAQITVIGGKGKEFWTGGKNWELHPKHDKKYIGKLHGNWRIEITPDKESEFDMFINLIQVANSNGSFADIKPEIKKLNGNIIITFEYANKNWQISVSEKSGVQSQIVVKK